ncbi:hypothetical protein B296_00007099 [Ensete ventricosum]|uniref:Uncharacterized protein n=1 Tax=Ensete ventricosum TaxID=4639 RepID=A0A426ZS70_ENSVE|nr:hypothetical protein B296_00007099 [Ensete ventricosum]
MLMEDDSQGDLDHEATAMVEVEEGSSNARCKYMVILQVRRGYVSVISKWLLCCWRMAAERSESRGGDGCSKGATATEGIRAAECTVVAEKDGSERLILTTLVDGSERSLLVAFVLQESAVSCDGSKRLMPVALCSERSLLVMIKSLLVTIKVDGSERSLLVTLCSNDAYYG